MGNYHPRLLLDHMTRIPFEDHGPPLLLEILYFCSEASRWLSTNLRTVIAVHCKGGKGRTGLMISALLLWTGHRRCALDALELFSFRRTENYSKEDGLCEDEDESSNTEKKRRNQGVDGPSQIRYVHYMEAAIYGKVSPYRMPMMYLESIRLPVGQQQKERPFYISFVVRCMRAPLLDSVDKFGVLAWDDHKGTVCALPAGLGLWGDVRIEFFRHANGTPKSKRKLAFFVMFNTAFYQGGSQIVFSKSRVDMLHKDKANKVAGPDFKMALCFQDNEGQLAGTGSMQYFQELCRSAGESVHLCEQDRLDSEPGELLVIIEGSVQKAFSELPISPGECHHPLGNVVHASHEMPQRVPAVSIQGPISVIGIRQFMLGSNEEHSFHARTAQVEAIRIRSSSRKFVIQPTSMGDIEVEGISGSGERLLKFYGTVAFVLSRQRLRLQEEIKRIQGLRLMGDKESLLADEHELELLRSSCIKCLNIPKNKKIVLQTKALLESQRGSRPRTIRLIVMDGFLIIDPAIYGPAVGSTAEAIAMDELLRVRTAQDSGSFTRAARSLLMLSFENDLEYEFMFSNVEKLRHVYTILSAFHQLAQDQREKMGLHLFEGPLIKPLLKHCGKEHQLHKNKGQDRMSIRSSPSSVFIVVEGDVRVFMWSSLLSLADIVSDALRFLKHCWLCRSGERGNIVRQGSSFGIVEFLHRLPLTGIQAMCHTKAAKIVELPSDQILEHISLDSVAGSALYRAMAIQIQTEIDFLYFEGFPQTLSHLKRAEITSTTSTPTASFPPIRSVGTLELPAEDTPVARPQSRAITFSQSTKPSPATPQDKSRLPKYLDEPSGLDNYSEASQEDHLSESGQASEQKRAGASFAGPPTPARLIGTHYVQSGADLKQGFA